MLLAGRKDSLIGMASHDSKDCLPDIFVGIPCAPNCERFAALVIDTARRTATEPQRLVFHLAVPNEASESAYGALAETTGAIIHPVSLNDLPPIKIRNSIAHCRGLQVLLDAMDTKFGMFCDNDIAFLRKGWDIKLTELLSGEKIIVGSTYPNTPLTHIAIENRPDNPKVLKYQNFPNVIACLFKVDALKSTGFNFNSLEKILRKNDFKPVLLDQEDALRSAGLDSSCIWMLDTGFDLPLKVRRAGFEAVNLEFVESGEGLVFDGPLLKRLTDGTVFDESSEEYQLDDIPFFTHFGKASRRSFHSEEARLWIGAVERWLSDGKQAEADD